MKGEILFPRGGIGRISMKKVISVVLVFILFFTYFVPVYAKGNLLFEDESICSPDNAPQGSPEWSVLNSISVTFFISNSGTAYVSYLVSTRSANGVTVKVSIERQTLGLFWKKVDINTSGDIWTDRTTEKYLEKSHSVKISGNGDYRVVLEITANGETHEMHSYTSYNRNQLKGDADGNGRLTAADARLILRHCAKLVRLSSLQQVNCDINNSGGITAADARLTLQMSAGLI